jgi:hypothetical protein
VLAAAVAAAVLTISPAGADSHTFDRAYHAARPGAVVRVLPGSYPAQDLTAGGGPVIFAGSGSPSVGEVHVDGATNIEFRDLAIHDWTVNTGDHITFRRVRTLGAFFIHAPSSWISIIGGSVGPSHNYSSQIAVPDQKVTQPSRHILIDGVRFHDVTRGEGKHVECLMLADGDGVTIRNSVFTRCAVFDLFVTWWYFWPSVGPPTNVVIQHNSFDPAVDGYYSMLWADYVNRSKLAWTGFTVSGNTCRQHAEWGSTTQHVRFTTSPNAGC